MSWLTELKYTPEEEARRAADRERRNHSFQWALTYYSFHHRPWWEGPVPWWQIRSTPLQATAQQLAEAYEQQQRDEELLRWFEDTPRRLRQLALQATVRWHNFRLKEGFRRSGGCDGIEPLDEAAYQLEDDRLRAEYRKWHDDDWEPRQPLECYTHYLRDHGSKSNLKLAGRIEREVMP